jgi:crotonobetainyl-CoA:carnitine CoA-transferase CaiB-like acyl-CoA transferase
VEDEHLRGRRALVELPDGGLAMGPPFRFSEAPARAPAAPELGEHQSKPWAGPHRPDPVPDPGSRGYFEGLRVVDLSRVWAGPLVTRTLADLGADVIKVERADAPEGMRGGFPSANDTSGDYWNRSAYFAARNAGKRTLSLDLTVPEGRAIVHQMLEGADVLVENFTPGVMGKFGLDYETLRQRYPRLVLVSISGYGQDGPRKKDPAFGLSIEPAAGISVVTGYEGEEPTQSGNTLLDSLAGMHATAGLLAALIARERSGRGQWVDVSMQEVALQMSAPHIMDFAINGRLASTAGNRRSGSVRGTYPCRGDDEWVAVSAQGDEGWRALCAVAGQPQWTDDPRFEDPDQRASNHDELDRLVAAWTRGLTKFEVMERLQAAGVGAGALLKADEILTNDQLAARGFFGPIDLPGYGVIPLQRFCPSLFDGEGFNARVRAPLLGEHTHELLAELGLGPREIEELRASGVTEPELGAFEAPAARKARRLPLESLLEQGSLLRIDANYREIVRRALDAQRSAKRPAPSVG